MWWSCARGQLGCSVAAVAAGAKMVVRPPVPGTLWPFFKCDNCLPVIVMLPLGRAGPLLLNELPMTFFIVLVGYLIVCVKRG